MPTKEEHNDGCCCPVSRDALSSILEERKDELEKTTDEEGNCLVKLVHSTSSKSFLFI